MARAKAAGRGAGAGTATAIEDPLAEAHRRLDALAAALEGQDLDSVSLGNVPEARALWRTKEEQVRTAEAAVARLKALREEDLNATGPLGERARREKRLLDIVLWAHSLWGLPVTDDLLADVAEVYARFGPPSHDRSPLRDLQLAITKRGPSVRLCAATSRLVATLRRHLADRALRSAFPDAASWDEWVGSLEEAAEFSARRFLKPGEAWSDGAIADLDALPEPERVAWFTLMAHGRELPSSGRPKEDWLAKASELVDAVGFDAFKGRLLRWFPLVDRPRTAPWVRQKRYEPDMTHTILPEHATILRGLVWCCQGRADRDLARALARLAISAYRKIPKVGPRLVALGNACVVVLGTMPGVEVVGQLAMLKSRVKFGTALKEVEKAFDAAAKREDLPREEIEELAVPAYGMEEVGVRREEFGEYTAEMVVDTGGVAIRWSKEGSPLKSAPAAARTENAEAWKELQAAAKDAEAMLTTVRDRLDSLFLARKTWPLAAWRERYLDHPLVGVVARRLIWTFTNEDTAVDAIFDGGRLVGRDGREVEGLGEGTTVALWHPIGRGADEVLGWREWLEAREVRQPFKQAHREVYVLTDAERRTETYSNRFAAHLLKQHQFHSLCAARGWKNKLRLMVDDTYPPATRLLPEWGLRAEFWVEGAGDEYGRDTNESGAFLYLSTDQVRFYPLDAPQRLAHASGRGYQAWQDDQPLALEEVPPLVFSEVMRDVDLFVGVASVGNDPTWSDGGPGGRYADYWRDYSFGDLSATAQTRKAVLERLVPRLKIADRCSFADRFLVVRGDLRTYKIHLGSGNILMEPNDQYLCIVPKPSSAAHATGPVFLPFEGDGMLSIILSKALLLADDRKIKDETITRQIRS